MVSAAMMALVKDYKRVICDFDVSATKAIEKHLRDHYCNSGFLHFLKEGLSVGHHAFNPFSPGNGLVIASFSVDAYYLINEVFRLPIKLDVLIA